MVIKRASMVSDYLLEPRKLSTVTILSGIVTVLMVLASIVGLIIPAKIYPTIEIQQSFVANDVVNLILGLPILLGAIILTWRGNPIGLLLWPGALLYIIYNYVAYIFGMPSSGISVAYLVLILLSTVIIVELLKNIKLHFFFDQLAGKVPEKLSGWVLLVFGCLFIVRAAGMIIGVYSGQAELPMAEFGTLIADIVLSILMIVGGVLSLRRIPLGYVTGLNLLFVASALFLGLIVFLLLQPILTDVVFDLVGVIVVFIMGLFCFIPYGLYLRSVLFITWISNRK